MGDSFWKGLQLDALIGRMFLKGGAVPIEHEQWGSRLSDQHAECALLKRESNRLGSGTLIHRIR